MIRIQIPEDYFSKKLESAKKLKNWIDKQWNLCEQGEKDCDEVDFITRKQVDNFLAKNLSFNSFVRIFDKKIDRKDNQEYDVTKIIMSKEDQDKFFDYDLTLLKIFKGDFYKENKLKSDISMYHLMSGFKIKDIPSGFVFLEDNVLKEKEL